MSEVEVTVHCSCGAEGVMRIASFIETWTVVHRCSDGVWFARPADSASTSSLVGAW